MPRRASSPTLHWLALTLSLLWVAGWWSSLHWLGFSSLFLFWGLAMVPLTLLYRSWTVALESSTAPLVGVVFRLAGFHDEAALAFIVVVVVLLWAVHRLDRAGSTLLGLVLTVGWVVVSLPDKPGAMHAVIWVWALLAWALLLQQRGQRPRGPLSSMDLVLTSYSANTAHLAECFLEGASQAGAQVRVHRFHHIDLWSPRLEAEALVLAFPVVGWKPPWPYLDWLITGLPRGQGKPAFILYSAGGGPENTAALLWLLLTLKGYRVLGQGWNQYMLNIATVRLGPAAWWRWMDRLVPLNHELGLVSDMGADLARGQRSGWPIVFYPSLLVILGVLLDNRWLNTVLYRNHIWKKKCTGCGLCVRTCPVGRLSLVDGRPKARGTCAICLACINLCPSGAMEMWFFSEYGQPYPPRWPHLLVKRRPKALPVQFDPGQPAPVQTPPGTEKDHDPSPPRS